MTTVAATPRKIRATFLILAAAALGAAIALAHARLAPHSGCHSHGLLVHCH